MPGTTGAGPAPPDEPPSGRPADAAAGVGPGAGRRSRPGHVNAWLAARLTVARELHRLESGELPSWLRPSRGEHRLPVVLAIGAAVALQVLLPGRYSLQPRWVLPGLELALTVGLTVVNPVRVTRQHPAVRAASLLLIAAMTTANGISAVLLIRLLVGGRPVSPGELLSAGVEIYLTNVIAFALWYWDLDRGGPAARAAVRRVHPDFLFPQMATPHVAPKDWRPTFVDYFYVSFTNATAFSPTDTMPLSRWAKLLMTAQSAVSLGVVALVVARAVNVL